MSTTIESLQLQIVSNSQSAINSINTLTQSLTKLRSATNGGLGLNNVVKQMQSSRTAINNNTNALKQMSSRLSKLTSNFSAFSKRTNAASTSMNTMSKVTKSSSMSFSMFTRKFVTGFIMFKRIYDVIRNTIDKISDYIENVNLFTVAMGQYAEESMRYAEQVSEIMGIDPSEWIRNQGVFMTLATGFGVASDKAAIMSKNLTQLGYDISSFYNLDVDDAMQKLQSGLAGELEPLRRIGYDLSQAKLQAVALELGIDKAISSMTQAEKSMLRYHAIMTQVTTVHGDMARTLDAPANQLRILKAQGEMLVRSIGSLFIPMLNKVLPYIITMTKMLREAISTLATAIGFELPEVDYTGVESMASGSEDTAEALEDASAAAKKLKSYTMGIDELNVISPNDESSDSVEDTLSGFDFELVEYDFIGNATNERIESIRSELNELLKPLKEFYEKRIEWVKGLDFKPLVDGFNKIVEVVKPTLESLWEFAGWMEQEIVFPIAGWVVEEALPKALEVVGKALEFIGEFLKPVIEGVKELKHILEPIVEWLGEEVKAVFDGIASIFEKLTQTVTENEDGIKGIFTGLGEIIVALKPLLDDVISLIKDLLDIVGDLLADVLKNAIDILGGLVDFVAGVLTGDWERAWDGLKREFTGIWNLIVSIFEAAWKIIVSVISTAWDIIVGIFTPVAEWFNENVIKPIANFFKGLWESISGFFVNLWEDIKGIWNTVATWFNNNVIQPIVNFFAPIVEWISQFFYGLWLIIQAVWVVSSTWFNENVIIPIVGFFKGVWESVSSFFTSLWEDIKKVWDKVSTWFDTYVVQPVVDFFKGVWTSVSGFFTSLWEDIKEVWNKVSTWFDDEIIKPVKTAFEKACEAIGGFFESLWLSIRQGLAKAMNGVIDGIESAINGVIDGINWLIGGFDKVVQWAADILGKDWGGISIVQKVQFDRITVPTFAQGGFPDSGQTFIARENGIPEMVGTIGRRTAVANNDQIVESVASGVAEANNEQNILLREQNSLLRALLEKDTGVYLDGRSLSKSVDKFKNEQGRVILGGAL